MQASFPHPYHNKKNLFQRPGGGGPTPQVPGGGETPKPEREKLVDQEMDLQKIGDLPGLEKPEEVKSLDVNDEKDQSAKTILENLNKVYTMKPEELVKTFRERYNAYVDKDEITFEDRKHIRDQEFERFQNLASDDAKKRIQKIMSKEPTRTYSDALSRIKTGYQNIDDQGETKAVIEKLQLEEVYLTELRQKQVELNRLNEEKSDAEERLKPLQDKIDEHKKNVNFIDRLDAWWNRRTSWSLLKPVLKTAAYGLAAATVVGTIGGLGAGLLAMKTGTVAAAEGLMGAGFWGALKSGATLALSPAWNLISSIPGAVGLSSTATLGLSGIGIGLYEYANKAISLPWKFLHGQKEWTLEREKIKARAKEGIDTTRQDAIDEATDKIKELQKKNAEKSSKIGTEIEKWKKNSTDLQNRIHHPGERENVDSLQQQLESMEQIIVDLETMKSLLDATQDTNKIGLNERVSIDDTLRNIQDAIPDPKMRDMLSAVATEIDAENKKQQQLLHGTAYKEKIKKQLLAIDQPEMLTDLKNFLERGGNVIPARCATLQSPAPELYRVLKALAALPSDNKFRINVSKLLKHAVEVAEGEPNRRSVMEALGRIKDEEMRHFISGKPRAITEFHNNIAELDHPSRGLNFEKWIQSLPPEKLEILKDTLEKIRTSGGILNARLIDKMTPLREEVTRFVEGELSEDLQNYLRNQAKTRLEAAASKVGFSQKTFSIPNPVNGILDNIRGIADEKELISIRDLLFEMKEKLYQDPTSQEIELVKEAEKQIVDAINAIRPEEVRNYVRSHPEAIIALSRTMGVDPALENPSTADQASLEKYGKKEIRTVRKPSLLQVVQELSGGEYVLENNVLMKNIEKLKQDISNRFGIMERIIRDSTGNPNGKLTKDIFKDAWEKLKDYGSRVAPDLNRATEVLDSLIASSEKEELAITSSKLLDMQRKFYFSISKNKFENMEEIDRKFEHQTYELGHNLALLSTHPDIIPLNQGAVANPRLRLPESTSSSLEEYFNSTTDYNLKEQIMSVIKKIGKSHLPKPVEINTPNPDKTSFRMAIPAGGIASGTTIFQLQNPPTGAGSVAFRLMPPSDARFEISTTAGISAVRLSGGAAPVIAPEHVDLVVEAESASTHLKIRTKLLVDFFL